MDKQETSNVRRAKKPTYSPKELPQPQTGNKDNTVNICGTLVEIKPTKIRYQVDRTASFYRILDNVPLVDVLSADVGVFEKGRDGSQCVIDWLVAATDMPDLIIENYHELDTEVINRILEIFRRVNRIDEMEEKAKNGVATAKGEIKD